MIRIGQIETEYEVERPRSARRRVCGSRYLEVEMFLAAEQEDGRVWGQSQFELTIGLSEYSVSFLQYWCRLGWLLWSRALFCSRSWLEGRKL